MSRYVNRATDAVLRRWFPTPGAYDCFRVLKMHPVALAAFTLAFEYALAPLHLE